MIDVGNVGKAVGSAVGGGSWRVRKSGIVCTALMLALLSVTARATDDLAASADPTVAAQRAAAESPVSPGSTAAAESGQAPAQDAGPRGKPSRYAPDRFAGRASIYYGQVWGIDSLSVRLVQSGELVRFTYRVIDPSRSRPLNDKQTEARLEAPRAGVSLVVPTMEKVGQLRQTATPEAGRSYWMTFSNKGRRVARGDRVDVVIGTFRANNLIVD